MKKTKTISLQGKEYAQVKDRLKEFRKDWGNGAIETSYDFKDGFVIFKSKITQDRSDETSAIAEGHAFGKIGQVKAFEKLETIAVGRALAMLGYASDGEIASFEEMEKFEVDSKPLVKKLKSAKTPEELKAIWDTFNRHEKANPEVLQAKDDMKASL